MECGYLNENRGVSRNKELYRCERVLIQAEQVENAIEIRHQLCVTLLARVNDNTIARFFRIDTPYHVFTELTDLKRIIGCRISPRHPVSALSQKPNENLMMLWHLWIFADGWL